MKKIILPALLLCAVLFKTYAQIQPRWIQQAAISPDGKWIAFEYKGNIFKVPATGGDATALTISESYSG